MGAGFGMLKGLGVTLKTMSKRSVTRQYPDVKPVLPPRTRGVIALMEENCTVCMLCSRECPDWCIYIDSHKETVPPKEPGARARTRNILDRFAIDFALCMYCGICVEVCPFDALFWSPEFEYSEYDIRDLVHEKERLREWMYTVPAPPVLDPDGTPAAELVAAAKAEPKVYEAPSLGGAPVAAPVAAAPAAAAAPAVEAAPAEAAPAAKKPAREHAEIAKEDVGVDQAVFDAAIAAGMPERQARAKAKSAWMKVWKKQNAVEAPAEPEATTAAPTPPQEVAAAPGAAAESGDLKDAEGGPVAGPADATGDVAHDIGEPQIDQEVYDKAIAEGLPDRVARSKAKSAWVKKARKGLA